MGAQAPRRHTLSTTSIEDIGISNFSCVLCQKMLLILFLTNTSDGFFDVVKKLQSYIKHVLKKDKDLYLFYEIVLKTNNNEKQTNKKYLCVSKPSCFYLT